MRIGAPALEYLRSAAQLWRVAVLCGHVTMEGFAEGIAEGFAEGFAKGFAEGLIPLP